MLKVILIALAGLLVFFCWCLCKMSSICSREEEMREDYEKVKKFLD